MAISIGRGAATEEVKVPKVWFFPKTRMRRAIGKAGYVIDDISTNSNAVFKTVIYKDSNEVGSYIRGGYYANFETNDETLKQIVMPYANVSNGR